MLYISSKLDVSIPRIRIKSRNELFFYNTHWRTKILVWSPIKTMFNIFNKVWQNCDINND